MTNLCPECKQGKTINCTVEYLDADDIIRDCTGADQDPDQPPGISSYTHNLPPAAEAAERVNRFLSEFGDGRIDQDDDALAPLFARDLQALTNSVLRKTT